MLNVAEIANWLIECGHSAPIAFDKQLKISNIAKRIENPDRNDLAVIIIRYAKCYAEKR